MISTEEIKEIICYVVDKAMESSDTAVSVNFYNENIKVSTYRVDDKKY